MDWWFPASGKENPPPIFTFWPFELWPALPLLGLVAGRALLLFLPPMITWTLSHCSCHPKQLYFIWELSWLYQPHLHTGTICTDHCIPNAHCRHTYKTYSTCKYYQTWLRSDALNLLFYFIHKWWKCFLQLRSVSSFSFRGKKSKYSKIF